MNNNKVSVNDSLSSVIIAVKSVLNDARSNAAYQVNSELLTTYWNIGRIICEYEQSSPSRADYGMQTLKMDSCICLYTETRL